MIEERLRKKGTPQSQLDEFNRSPKHNAKEDVFSSICSLQSLEDLKRFGEYEQFFGNLVEVLLEVGKENHPEFQLAENHPRRQYLGEERYNLLIVAKMASKMFGTLRIPGKYGGWDYSLTLDKIYKDTFEVK